MTETGADMLLRESRAARRLGRLFRIERAGGFDRRPVATMRRLIERREALVKELLRFDSVRRSLASPRSAELDEALGTLAREVGQALNRAQTQAERIDGDLRLRRGEGLSTGVRDTANGRLLGKI